MPIYEYKCTRCIELIEVLQRMDDPELTECPKCKRAEGNFMKVPSTYGMKFVGNGFYVNDYNK